MAIPLPIIASSLKGHSSFTFPSEKPAPPPLLTQNNNRFQERLKKLELATRRTLPVVLTRVLSERNESTAQQEEEKKKLSQYWREIHGENNWSGYLDPMDPLLRSELIRYGDMVQACYDSFNYDPYSQYCGSCNYSPRTLFESLGLTFLGYEVSRYLYATADIKLPNFFKNPISSKVWSRSANWIGYVCVSNDETSAKLGRRDIAIAWRGTVTRLEWVADLLDYLKPVTSAKIPCPDPTVTVESGFLDVYTNKDKDCRFCKYSAREQVLTEMRSLMLKYPNEELSITVTGHSLGAALAVLSAYDIVESGLNKTEDGRTVPVTVFSFAGPRVGNVRFKNRVEGLGVKVLRVVNVNDDVPKVPGMILNENDPTFLQKLTDKLPWSYSHVGVELALNNKHSPYLKETNDPLDFHNLEAYLHLLDGYQGKDKKFKLSDDRDIALVNKSSDFLNNELVVPPSWWQAAYKGMVKKDGRWVEPERPTMEDHPSEMAHHMKQLGLDSDS
ncbi:phospholipase A1-Igamma2, chloroplastic-like [Macadamia integrifolia]|uniref:phospholipase A1-Igamma2, chloroplastic-like n=1 Tax=Macadamia integrifolia TaxID=60698 RepID=UPI001C4E8399|nr:phospholipase A1-Igamma2, chloroplastic-like [Macadamia integrifolia]